MENNELLAAVKLVEKFSTDLHSTSWVWGGLTTDISQGCILREHDDLDYLTQHLHELVDPLTGKFQAAGWSARRLENGDLKLKKDGIKIQLGHIEFSQKVRWTHNGERGSLFFPTDWLPRQPKRFYDLDVHVVAPELQYVLLEQPELLNPDWRPRKKDMAAKAYLKTLLEGCGTAPDDLHARIHA
jgi:hypothetical protein